MSVQSKTDKELQQELSKVKQETWEQVRAEVRAKKKLGYQFGGKRAKLRWMFKRALEISNKKSE